MDVGIACFFRAPLGGLQENVRSTAGAIRHAGGRVRIVCPGGPFLESLHQSGFEAFAVDFSSPSCVKDAEIFLANARTYHAHPGHGRVMAQRLARQYCAPLILTIHGRWMDDFEHFITDLRYLVCVSPAIREMAVAKVPDEFSHMIRMVPNGIDCSHAVTMSLPSVPTVIVPSRFDEDKRPLIDLLISLWQAQVAEAKPIRWEIVGAGTLLPFLQTEAARLHHASSNSFITFHGWQDQAVLRKLYTAASFAIAPGRSAMEALSHGLPTIAAGSGGVIPVLSEVDLTRAAYSNFGGYGTSTELPAPANCLELIRASIDNSTKAFRRIAAHYIRDKFSDKVVGASLLELYS